MKVRFAAALLNVTLPLAAFAQTGQDLLNDGKTPGDVLTYGMGMSQHRYSPATQIDRNLSLIHI